MMLLLPKSGFNMKKSEIFNTQNPPSHKMLFYSRLIKGKERRGEGGGGRMLFYSRLIQWNPSITGKK